MNRELVEDYESLSARAAELMLNALDRNPRIVLGLPTGRTPEGMYARVVSACSAKYHCFSEARTFNLDEYVGVATDHPGSYYTYMKRHLFEHVDLDPRNIHIPDGRASSIRSDHPDIPTDEALELECRAYEEAISRSGGLDLVFLGLGRNGHIAFNEPGAPFSSRTRVVTLSESTQKANAPYFPDGNVPDRAITMGIATILEARRIVVLASGSAKADVVRRLEREPVTVHLPASALRNHPHVSLIVDRAAAALV